MHAVARAVAATPAVANCARPRGPSNNRRHRFNRPAGAATPGTTRRSRWNSDAAFDATLRERVVAMAKFAPSTSAIGASEGDRVTGSEAGAVNGTERELSYNGASSSAASSLPVDASADSGDDAPDRLDMVASLTCGAHQTQRPRGDARKFARGAHCAPRARVWGLRGSGHAAQAWTRFARRTRRRRRRQPGARATDGGGQHERTPRSAPAPS